MEQAPDRGSTGRVAETLAARNRAYVDYEEAARAASLIRESGAPGYQQARETMEAARDAFLSADAAYRSARGGRS